jgi:hypothetical protein
MSESEHEHGDEGEYSVPETAAEVTPETAAGGDPAQTEYPAAYKPEPVYPADHDEPTPEPVDTSIPTADLSASIKDGSFHKSPGITRLKVERLPLESHAVLVRLSGAPTDEDIELLHDYLGYWHGAAR